ncbi:MAG: LysM peptidoglycan-binding domain-containing protein [Cytophagales bacterium]|nr:LysM peptidoglycan-binding domain-containing protein [Cytophagales bacterium]
MKKVVFLLLISHQLVAANGPTVPSQLEFGGMTLKLTSSAQRTIQKHVDALHASPRHHQIAVDRARLYFPIIERIFAEERVPDAIKYLAIQESSLISDAVSSANAVGYWQFKDFTAREMGLRVDRRIDERKNIVSASKGAAKYLNQNNFYYKNWIYAVMAYNTGRGGAKKHLDHSNFGVRKMTISDKTHWYVLKFLAHYIAFRGEVDGPHSEGWQLAEFNQGENRDLNGIAREFDADTEKVKEYNKWLSSNKIPTEKAYTVIIPVQGKIPKGLVAYSRPSHGRIKEATSKKYPDELIPGLNESQNSTIIQLNGLPAILAKPTDDIASLSVRVGLSEKQFRKYNELKEADELISGEFYYTKKKKSKSRIKIHITQHNETLWDISQQYGLRVDKLAKMNRMSIIDDAEPGRVMWLARKLPKDQEVQYHELPATLVKEIPDERTTQTTPTYAPASNQKSKVKYHTVAKGESLTIIADKYDISVKDIQRWNELENPDDINVGQNLQVKAPISERSNEKNFVKYTIVQGDTLYRISRKFSMSVDDIMELNSMSSPDLSIGQMIKVYEK